MTPPKGHIEITRTMGIDMGHRVTNHDSKCKNVHGHRYTVEVTATALQLVKSGASEGMITDFGVVKTAMAEHLEDRFDHGLCLWVLDPLAIEFAVRYDHTLKDSRRPTHGELVTLAKDGPVQMYVKHIGNVILLDVVPTAEQLAKVWYTLIDRSLRNATLGKVWITAVKVWETPNCFATYTPPAHIARKYGKRKDGTA